MTEFLPCCSGCHCDCNAEAVRELHKPIVVQVDNFGTKVTLCSYCPARQTGWPCPTARLVYSDDEIKQATTPEDFVRDTRPTTLDTLPTNGGH